MVTRPLRNQILPQQIFIYLLNMPLAVRCLPPRVRSRLPGACVRVCVRVPPCLPGMHAQSSSWWTDLSCIATVGLLRDDVTESGIFIPGDIRDLEIRYATGPLGPSIDRSICIRQECIYMWMHGLLAPPGCNGARLLTGGEYSHSAESVRAAFGTRPPCE